MSQLYHLRLLDQKLSHNQISIPTPPRQGWVKSIRLTLGMTYQQLAMKLGVSDRRVAAIEKAEIEGKLKIETLQKVAHALGCNLEYVLTPKKDMALFEQVTKKARSKATKILTVTDQHMSLENQSTREEFEAQVEALTQEILHNHFKSIWDED